MEWLLVACSGGAAVAAGRWLRARADGRRRRVAGGGNSLAAQDGARRGQPLRVVVAQCEARWFLQELQLAMAGDATAMVRVSHMLLSGYGTRQDPSAAARWMRQAWALQNYKEPGGDAALQLELLDVRNSDVPSLNERQQPSRGSGDAAVLPPLAAAAGWQTQQPDGQRRQQQQQHDRQRQQSRQRAATGCSSSTSSGGDAAPPADGRASRGRAGAPQTAGSRQAAVTAGAAALGDAATVSKAEPRQPQTRRQRQTQLLGDALQRAVAAQPPATQAHSQLAQQPPVAPTGSCEAGSLWGRGAASLGAL